MNRCLAVAFALGLLSCTAFGFSETSATLPQPGGTALGSAQSSVLANDGTFAKSYDIPAGPGRNGFAPKLVISYSSSSGNGPLGIGWSLPVFSIYRSPGQTPNYSDHDIFYSSVHGELTAVGGGFFRPLASTSFELYKFDGRNWMYWNASGERRTFAARMESGGATAKWMVTAELDSDCRSLDDPNCNRIAYDYIDATGVASTSAPLLLLEKVSYNYLDGRPQTSLAFSYADERPDPVVSFLNGFASANSNLLLRVSATARGQESRALVLSYEKAAKSGFSMLSRVDELGRNQSLKKSTSFLYSSSPELRFVTKALSAEDTSRLVGTGQSTVLFADLNGDAIPDVYSHAEGAARIRYGLISTNGDIRYGKEQVFSRERFTPLSDPTHFFADVDGDGVLDFLSTANRLEVRLNLKGSWSKPIPLPSSYAVNPNGVRFDLIDINGDGLVDIYETSGDGGQCYMNERGRGWTSIKMRRGANPANGGTASSGRSYLADINGDGLADYVTFAADGRLAVWYNQGTCSWTAPSLHSADIPFTQARDEGSRIIFSDFNGDGLADVAIVGARSVFIWLGSADGIFRFVAKLAVPDGIRSVTAKDINGDGQQDLIFCLNNGQCTALAPERAPKNGLLSEIRSSTGERTEVSYKSSVDFYGDDGWSEFAPFLAFVPSFVRETDSLFRDVGTKFLFQNMKFDAAYRRFGGFETIVRSDPPPYYLGKATGPATSTETTYSNGSFDSSNDPLTRALAGRLLRQRTSAGETAQYQYDFAAIEGRLSLFSVVTEKTQQIDGDGLILGSRIEQRYDENAQILSIKAFELLGGREDGVGLKSVTTYAYQSTSLIPNASSDVVAIRPAQVAILAPDGAVLRQERMTYGDLAIGQVAERSITGGPGANPQTTRFGYTAKFKKNMASTSDDRGEPMSSIEYQSDGVFPVVVRNGAGEASIVEFDLGTGLKLSEIDPNGAVHTYLYDDRWNLQKDQLVKNGILLGSTTFKRIEPQPGIPGKISTRAQTNERGDAKISVAFFDPAGKTLEALVLGAGGRWFAEAGAMRPDSAGRTAQVSILAAARNQEAFDTAPLTEARKEFAYDAAARLRKIVYPLEGLSESFSYRVDACSDAKLCLITAKLDRHPKQNRTDSAVYAFNRTLEVRHIRQSRPSSVYRYDWNGLDQLTKMRLPDAGVRAFARDMEGKILVLTDSKAGKLSFNYDGRGRLLQKVWNDSRQTVYTYDRADRLVSEVKTDVTANVSETVRYAFGRSAKDNELGRLKSVSFASGEDIYHYDNRGKTVRRDRNLRIEGQQRRYSVTSVFDWLDQPLSATSAGIQWSYRYDQHGTLAEIPGIVQSIDYDDGGRIVGLRYASGATSHQDLSPENGRALAVRVVGQHSTLEERYNYDEVLNMKSRETTEPIVENEIAPGASELVVYDHYLDEPSYQIRSYKAGGQGATYEWTVAGDRSDEAYRILPHKFNSFGELDFGPGGSSWSYNVDSSATVIRRPGAAVGYNYDYDLQPVARTKNSKLERVFVNGDFHDVQGQGVVGVVRIGSIPVARISAGGVYGLHRDPLGSVIAVSDASGRFVQRTKYDPFGNRIERRGAYLSSLEPGFALGWDDFDAGVVRLGRRDLQPELSQFVSADPLILAGGTPFLDDPQQLNLRQYGKNNPLVYGDPSGLWSAGFNFYLGVGGGVTVGQNPGGGWFTTVQGGLGIGGGAVFDPNGSAPGYTKKGSYCSDGPPTVDAGVFAQAAASVAGVGLQTSYNAGFITNGISTDGPNYSHFTYPSGFFGSFGTGGRGMERLGGGIGVTTGGQISFY